VIRTPTAYASLTNASGGAKTLALVLVHAQSLTTTGTIKQSSLMTQR
jgi:hypothetical protein